MGALGKTEEISSSAAHLPHPAEHKTKSPNSADGSDTPRSKDGKGKSVAYSNEALKQRKKAWIERIALVTFALMLGAAYVLIPPLKQWVDSVVGMFQTGDFSAVRTFIAAYGSWAAAVSFFLMVFQQVIAPFPAFVITLSNANLFGWWQGALLSWSSAMAGAATCFWIARLLGRDIVEKLCPKTTLKKFDAFFEKYGSKSILIARLLPFVPFKVVSYAAGLTKMRFWSFFLATGVGQLPATIVYSYVGGMLTGGTYYLFMGLLCLFSLSVLMTILRSVWLKRQNARKHAGKSITETYGFVHVKRVVCKLYNTFLWAVAATLFASLSVWITMRINMGWIIFGVWASLFIIFLGIHSVRMSWKFTIINVTVCALVGLVVFGPAKLINAPAAFVREGLGQSHLPLSTINISLASFVIVGLVVILLSDLIPTLKRLNANKKIVDVSAGSSDAEAHVH